MQVGVYVRISEDTEGLGRGVTRQEADCVALAKRRGWTVSRTYSDNDISAFKRRVVRPDFEQLLLDLDAGRIDGIVSYDVDRFARKPTDLERAIDIYDSRRGLAFATVQGDLDLSTGDGRTMARILVAFANKASMDTSRRVTRKHLELARSGVPVGGNRPFGWKADKKTLDPKEARLVRKAIDDVLGGVALHAVIREWNAKGIRTTTGRPWVRGVLRNALISPRMAGFRVYQGGIARHEDGTPVTGLITPMVDVETWERVVATLTDPKRGSRHAHTGGRKYLLSGIVRCGGECGKLLFGGVNNRNGRHYYTCKANGGCGQVAITGVPLDAMVSDLVLSYLSSVEVVDDTEPFEGADALAEVDTKIAELMNEYSEGRLSGDVVFPTISKLERQQAELRADRTAWLRTKVPRPSPTKAYDNWDAMDTPAKREVIAAYLEAVVVRPASGPKGPKLDPDRVTPIWR